MKKQKGKQLQVAKIRVFKKGKSIEDTVFERSNIFTHYKIEDIDNQLDVISEERAKYENQKRLYTNKIDDLKEISGVDCSLIKIKEKDYTDFRIFSNWALQTRIARDEMNKILKDFPHFEEMLNNLDEDTQKALPQHMLAVDTITGIMKKLSELEESEKELKELKDASLLCLK